VSLPQIQSDWNAIESWGMLGFMADVFKLILWVILDLFRSRASLEAEIVALRQQLNVLRRKSARRPVFSAFDHLIFAGLYQIAPRITDCPCSKNLSGLGIGLPMQIATDARSRRGDNFFYAHRPNSAAKGRTI
jgi:hypothetical protein